MKIHDLGPPVHGRADEDCQKGTHDVVELGHTVVEGRELGVNPKVGVFENKWRSVWVVDLKT